MGPFWDNVLVNGVKPGEIFHCVSLLQAEFVLPNVRQHEMDKPVKDEGQNTEFGSWGLYPCRYKAGDLFPSFLIG